MARAGLAGMTFPPSVLLCFHSCCPSGGLRGGLCRRLHRLVRWLPPDGARAQHCEVLACWQISWEPVEQHI